MTVYVDNARNRYRGMRMSHMWADKREELLQMADAIGVSRRHVQEPPKASWLHFDICSSKRKLAISLGAKETDKYGPLYHCAMLDIASDDPARQASGVKQKELIDKMRKGRFC